MSSAHILNGLGEINPNWLSRILSAQADIGECQVLDMTRQDLNQDAGFVSQIIRVRMHYGDRPKGAPASVIVKLAPKDPHTRELGKLLGLFQREVAFYKNFAEGNPCNPPRAYFSEIADSGDSFTIVLEDLGNVDAETLLDGCTVAEAHSVLATLGTLHAKYWRGRNLDGHDWIPTVATMKPALIAMASTAVPGFLKRFDEQIPDALRAGINLAWEVYSELIDEAAKEPNQTLCHTDCHVGNFVFQDGGPRFFDWQAYMLQSYAADVAYFLNGNLVTAARRKHLDVLLDGYYAALCAGGVGDISRQDVTDDYHRQTAGQLVLIPLISGAFLSHDEKGALLAETWLPRYFAAMEDSNAPEELATWLAEART